eukprot:324541-Prorocentrum_lima.AAC.1
MLVQQSYGQSMLSTQSRDDVSSPQSSLPGATFVGRSLVTCFFPAACSSALCFAFCRSRCSMPEHQEVPSSL